MYHAVYVACSDLICFVRFLDWLFGRALHVTTMISPVRDQVRCIKRQLKLHSPLQKVSAYVRFPHLGTEGKNARRMSGSVLDPMSSRESIESNDKPQILVEIGTQFLQRRVLRYAKHFTQLPLAHPAEFYSTFPS